MENWKIYNQSVESFLEEYDGENDFMAVFCDPPYGLNFMGKKWDHGVSGVEIWKGVYNLLLPGSSMFSFGGTRTFHRLMCNIEDGGFECNILYQVLKERINFVQFIIDNNLKYINREMIDFVWEGNNDT